MASLDFLSDDQLAAIADALKNISIDAPQHKPLR
jgi:hypothetical protein